MNRVSRDNTCFYIHGQCNSTPTAQLRWMNSLHTTIHPVTPKPDTSEKPTAPRTATVWSVESTWAPGRPMVRGESIRMTSPAYHVSGSRPDRSAAPAASCTHTGTAAATTERASRLKWRLPLEREGAQRDPDGNRPSPRLPTPPTSPVCSKEVTRRTPRCLRCSPHHREGQEPDSTAVHRTR